MTNGTEGTSARKGEPCPLIEDGSPCDLPVFARGWCSKHYARWNNYGDPLYAVRRYVPQGEKCAAPEGCPRKPKRRGLCEMHARRELASGTTENPRGEEARKRLFWAKVDKNGPAPEYKPELGGCWLWTGTIHPETGYGQFANGKATGGTRLTHRISYQWLVGPIGAGKHLDHLCRVRHCLRPDHLEPVSPRENIRRGDQGAFWGFTHDPEAAPKPEAEKPTVCTECGRTDKPVYKSGKCRPCYKKWLKDPSVIRPRSLTVEDRFWAKVDKDGPAPAHRPDLGPCWLWTAGINKGTGYGMFAIRHGEMMDAHRFAYLLAHGLIPEKHDVHHLCHRRACVRSSHLSAVTRSENLADRKNRRDPAA